MIKLVIGNSMSRVEGVTAGQLRDLRKLTSYQMDPSAAYHSGAYNTTRYLMDKRGSFPSGLLYLVQGYLSKLKYSVDDHRRQPEGRQGLFKATLPQSPYLWQFRAAEACALEHRGIVSATTGTGKSMAAVLIIEFLQVPTLIVVPSLELKRQLTETMTSIFGAERVGGLGSALAIENVDALDPKKPLKGYDCIIIDEFHHSGAKTYRQLNQKAWTDVYYRFGLTATPFRSQEHERLLLESVLSKVIYRLGYHEAVKMGHIVPVEAYYIDVPAQECDTNSWPAVYSKLVVKNEKRNYIIKKLLMSLYANSTLCLVKEIAHGETLSCDRAFPFANGQNDWTPGMIRDFNSGTVNTLIGTTGILGEGVDTKPAEFIIIAGLGKSKNQFMQQVGRGLRRYPGKESAKIVIFRDKSHKFTLNHFKAQVKILKEEYGVIPSRLDL